MIKATEQKRFMDNVKDRKLWVCRVSDGHWISPDDFLYYFEGVSPEQFSNCGMMESYTKEQMVKIRREEIKKTMIKKYVELEELEKL